MPPRFHNLKLQANYRPIIFEYPFSTSKYLFRIKPITQYLFLRRPYWGLFILLLLSLSLFLKLKKKRKQKNNKI